MVQNTAATVKTYSTRSMADFRARILEMSFEGMLLEIDGREVSVPFVGKFNVSNLLAVYGAARMLGREAMEILTTLSTLHSVAGRFETLRSPSGYTAIVDYAHTPDALVNVLSAIHEVLKESRSLESKDSSLGLLLNDKALYDNLNSTVTSATDLLIDLKENPKRYVHFSLWGAKEKKGDRK